MLRRLYLRIQHIFKYINLTKHLTDDPFVNILTILKFQIEEIKDEIYLSDETIESANKLQDINLILLLLNKQIKNEYYTKLTLHQHKYPKDYIDLGQDIFELKEYRSDKEIDEDSLMLENAFIESQNDFDELCRILAQGKYHQDGIKSWIYE